MTTSKLVFELPGLYQEALMPGLQAAIESKFKGWLLSTGLPENTFIVTVAPGKSWQGDRAARLFLEDKELLYPESLAGEIGFSVSRQIPDLLLEEKDVIRHF